MYQKLIHVYNVNNISLGIKTENIYIYKTDSVVVVIVIYIMHE